MQFTINLFNAYLEISDSKVRLIIEDLCKQTILKTIPSNNNKENCYIMEDSFRNIAQSVFMED